MYDIAHPHYSGVLGFQEQLCSHYVIIVRNIVAYPEFRIRLSGSRPDAESVSLGLRIRDRRNICKTCVLAGISPESPLDPWVLEGVYSNCTLLFLISIFI